MTTKDVAEQLGYEVLAMLDDKDPLHPLASFSSYITEDTCFIPAFGNNPFRLEWCERLEEAGEELSPPSRLYHPEEILVISTKKTLQC